MERERTERQQREERERKERQQREEREMKERQEGENKKRNEAMELLKSQKALFDSNVENELLIAKNSVQSTKVAFEPNVKVPRPKSVDKAVNARREEYRSKLTTGYPNFSIPEPYLPFNLDALWKAKVVELQTAWENLKRERMGMFKFITSGDHKCRSCGYNHGVGVTHKRCKNTKKSPEILWYWIEEEWGLCSGCHLVDIVTSVVCYQCSKPMPNITISHDRPYSFKNG